MSEIQKFDKKGLEAALETYKGQLARALPKHIEADKLLRVVMNSVAFNPRILECEKWSVLGAVFKAAQMGIVPDGNLGHGWLIPRKNKGVLQAQFQVGYQGLMELAYRSGAVDSINAFTVYENDVFEQHLGTSMRIVHKPKLNDRGNPIAYYATVLLKGSDHAHFAVISVEEAEEHRRRFSQARTSSPWDTDFDAMAKKTAIIKALKYAPKSSDRVALVVQDDEYQAAGVDVDMPVEVVQIQEAENPPTAVDQLLENKQ